MDTKQNSSLYTQKWAEVVEIHIYWHKYWYPPFFSPNFFLPNDSEWLKMDFKHHL